MMILNGRVAGDFWGNFTHYNNNGGASTIDLSITSCNIFEHIMNFKVLPQLEISSHCKITTEIDNPFTIIGKKESEYNWIKIPYNYKWDENSKKNYTNTINSNEIKTIVNEAKQLLDAGLIESTSSKFQHRK